MRQNLIRELLSKNIIQYGNFTLKSGKQSNLYFDLRTLITYPILMNQILNLMYQKVKEYNLSFDLICGIAYTGIPMATKLSLDYNIPMILVRKERKDYGTKKLIEGIYQGGQSCLMLDDVITTGSSLLESIKLLEEEGLVINDILVFIDRREGDRNDVSEYQVHSVFTVDEIMDIIKERNDIEMNLNSNLMTNRLYDIMLKKKTNLVLSADLTKKEELLDLISTSGPYVCMVKIHADIIEDFDQDFVYQLTKMADVYNFMIMEDRKFADIGQTVKNQYMKGFHQIVEWADFVTVHSIMGQGTIDAIREGIQNTKKSRGVFLLESVSSKDNLIDLNYALKTEQLAKDNMDIVCGLISQKRMSSNSDLLYATPGVNMGQKGDSLGQRYNNPRDAIFNKGADMIIVGRGIYGVIDRVKALEMYREEGWMCYKLKIDKYNL
jgi:uridine monophosphate synthetase